MSRTKSRSICVKFRESDPDQMAAWEFLQKDRGKQSYADVIVSLIEKAEQTESVAERGRCDRDTEMLEQIRQCCLDIRDQIRGIGEISAGGNDNAGESTQKTGMIQKEIPAAVTDLMRQLCGEDDEI